MSGLLLLGVFALWIWACVAMARSASRGIRDRRLRMLVAAGVSAVALVLPVADELVARQQFKALCEKYAVQVVDETRARDARLVFVEGIESWYAPSTAVPVRIQPTIYRDATTQDLVVSYHTLQAQGGLLIRTLGLSETTSPLLFHRACGPKNQDAFKSKFNITVVN